MIEQLTEFHRRLDRLETGIKPMVLLSPEVTDTFTVLFADGSGRENMVRSYNFAFPDNVSENPLALPYIEFSSTGGDSSIRTWWHPEDKLSADLTKSYLDIYVANFSITTNSSVTIKLRWLYQAASSASQ